jgi:hypothetical protein
MFFIFFRVVLFAQNDKISVVLLKGKSFVLNTNNRNELIKSNLIILNKNDTIELLANSNLIAYDNKVQIEIGGLNDQKLTYSQVNNLLKKVKPKKLSSNFINYLGKIYQDEKKKEYSYGATTGAASRGIENKIPSFSPEDNSIILNDTIVLIFCDPNSSLVSKLTVTNQNTNEEIYNDMPNTKNISIFDMKPGNYNWVYKIQTNEKKMYEFQNIFIVPDTKEKNKRLNEISNFKKYLNECKKCFSEDAREILIDDFYKKNKFYTSIKK